MPALEKMRVLDMTQYEAGTSCTQALAWLGADVVKVERPGTGDPGRGVARGTDHSAYFLNWNSNKRSIAIDLGSKEGREILLEMLPNFDVFVENYGPGVIENLDLDYDVMKRVNPRIIHARLKGFGLTGPYSGYKSYDMVAQAAGGAFSVTGEADGIPMRPGYTVGDSGTGVQLALAITAAYVHQQQTGEGQQVEISMQEAVTYFMRTVVATRSEWGTEAAPRHGNRGGPATDLYPCKPYGPNDYVYIMVVTTRMWDTFCTAIGRDDLLTDPRFASGEDRVGHVEELRAEITNWTSQQTKHEVMAILGPAGVPCSASLDTKDLFNDPHLESRNFVRQVEHPVLGDVPLLAWPPRLSASDVEIKAAPMLGEHTDSILAAELGLLPARIDELRKAGILGARPDAEIERERYGQPSTV
jgi:formyl-CoA transferase